MYSFLITVSIIISFILVIVVLLQASKGSGLAGTFGGAGGSDFGQVFGTRRTADFLSKVTWWLGGLILGLAIVINLFFLPGKKSADEIESIIQSSSRQNQVPAQPSLPPTFEEGQPAGDGTVPSTGAGNTDDNSGTDGQ